MKTFVSVWDAIEDSQSEAASMKARAQLVRALQKTSFKNCNATSSGISSASNGRSPRTRPSSSGRIGSPSFRARPESHRRNRPGISPTRSKIVCRTAPYSRRCRMWSAGAVSLGILVPRAA
jgi:hypothetical protein